jgi:hypothetical protein
MSHTAPTQTFTSRQKLVVHVEAFNLDGLLDPSVVLTAASNNAAAATAAVDASDPRAIVITGVAVGTANVTVGFSGCADTLIIPVSVVAAPNQSRVDFLSADPPVLK